MENSLFPKFVVGTADRKCLFRFAKTGMLKNSLCCIFGTENWEYDEEQTENVKIYFVNLMRFRLEKLMV